jgi:cell division protein FtsQ
MMATDVRQQRSVSGAGTEDGGVLHGFLLLAAQTVLVCALIAGVYFLLPWLRLTFDKPIARVIVHADLHALDQKSVMEAVAIYETDSFLNVDLDALVNRLEAQPWVARARARRHWPDTVEVDLVEQKPIAYWGDKAMVNAKGRIFEHHGLYQHQVLPRLWSELSAPAEAMNHYRIFEQQLQPLQLKLQSISQNVQGDWVLVLSNSLQVVLNYSDPVGNVRQFVTVYQQVIAPSSRAAINVDMRYQHGAAIRWAPQIEVDSKASDQTTFNNHNVLHESYDINASHNSKESHKSNESHGAIAERKNHGRG